MLLFALLSLSGCEALQGLLPGSSDAPPAEPAPPPRDFQTQLGDVRTLLRSGKAAKAASTAEALLAAHPEDDSLWDLVELTAIRAGTAGELVDRLSADQAIGGRVDRHQALRGVLAIEANRLGDAVNASRALAAVAPGDAAAIVALAVAKGAPVPDGLGAAEAALVAAMDPNKPLSAEADALPGWRAAIVRAQAHLARGDRAGAAIEAAKADGGGVRARTLAAVLRIRAAQTGDEAWSVADPAARASLEAGDVAGVAEILDAALPAVLRDGKGAAMAALGAELREKVGTNAEGSAAIAVVEAEAALRAGMPLHARDAATLASGVSATKVRSAWTLALAAAALGTPADLDAAAANLAEPRAGAAKDLARALRGQHTTLPSAGLTGTDAALQALLGAGWLADPGPVYARAAEAAGAEAPDLALWGALAASRAPLNLAADAPPALQAEQSARNWLAAGGTAAPLADTTHPAAAGWNALFGGTPAAADAPGVGAWSRGRAALAQGNAAAAAKEYALLAESAPAWRTGPWAPLLVLDGPSATDLTRDGAEAKAADPVAFAALLHGWNARAAGAVDRWQHGIGPIAASVASDKRAAVWDAAAGYRAGVLAWAAGREPWPAAQAQKLDEAERAAGLVRSAPPTVDAIRGALDGDAVFSLLPTAHGTEVLYLGASKGKVVELPASVTADTASLLAALRNGDSGIKTGDRLREAVIDPAMDVLLGIGRYIVIGPAPAGLLPVAALPEQSDGLRFLAAIRHVGYLPDFDALLAKPEADADGEVSILALCADASEADVVTRVYPDAVVLQGPKATVASFREQAPRARFVQIGAFPATEDGGFALADGALTLSDIASTPIHARAVAVTGGTDGATAAGRVAALRTAGARDILLEAWPAERRMRELLLLHYWEGINRRYTGARSLSEARTLAIREIGEDARLPGTWAGYFVFGRP